MVWKAGHLLISSSDGFSFFFFNYFLHPLSFSFPESTVKSICVGGGNEVTDQKRL